MKRLSRNSALPFRTALLFLLAYGSIAAQEARGVISLDVPPGWSDVTSLKKHPDILVALKGPRKSAFVLTRTEPINTSNRAQVRALLLDVLLKLNAKASSDYAIKTNLKTETYKNDLTAHYVMAEAKDSAERKLPQMFLGVLDFQGMTLVGTLMSAVPDASYSLLLGSVSQAEPSGASRRRSARRIDSLDGQLTLELRDGMEPVTLHARDKTKGFVLAVTGLGSEMRFLRVSEAAVSSKQERETLRATLGSIEGVDVKTFSTVLTVPTSEGPSLIYLSALVEGSGKSQNRFIVGYLPWGYWGYSVFVSGPSSEGLLRLAAQGLRMGPSAVPKLVAATPKLTAARGLRKTVSLIALALFLLALIVFIGTRIKK